MPRILSRTNSAACSFAALLVHMSVNASRKPKPPCAQRRSNSSRRSSSPTSSADLSLATHDPKTPCTVRLACSRFAANGQLHARLLRRVARAVVRRNAEVRRALEHRDVLGLPAMTGIDWIPDEPVPMTPTLRPLKSTPSWGQRPVWNDGPANESRPGMSGMRALERQPVAITQYLAAMCSPRSVVTSQLRSGLVELRADDPRVELDAAAQVEEIGDVVQVREDLGLGRVALAPRPARRRSGRRSCTGSRSSRRRSARRDSDSSTTCRRRRSRPRSLAPTARACASRAARAGPRTPRPRSGRQPSARDSMCVPASLARWPTALGFARRSSATASRDASSTRRSSRPNPRFSIAAIATSDPARARTGRAGSSRTPRSSARRRNCSRRASTSSCSPRPPTSTSSRASPRSPPAPPSSSTSRSRRRSPRPSSSSRRQRPPAGR